jgi:cytochrome bd-type quinol oxidase subunit 2
MKEWMIRNQDKIAVATGGAAWAVPVIALAQGGITKPEGVPSGFANFQTTFENIYNIIIIVAGIVFVALFLFGGIQYLTAAGNDEATKKARQLMLDAVIGLVIVVTAWAIGTYVLSLLGLGSPDELPDTPAGTRVR